jgi:hypothetical protein
MIGIRHPLEQASIRFIEVHFVLLYPQFRVLLLHRLEKLLHGRAMRTTTAIKEGEIDGVPGLCMNRFTGVRCQQDNKDDKQKLSGADHSTGVLKVVL